MMRKCFALLLCFLQATGPALASVLTVEEVSVIGAAADDYYTGSKSKLKVLDGGKIGRTLVPSAQLSSSFALSGLTAGAAGIAGIAYYERTGKDPVYAAAQAVASAADAIFVPAYQAFKANFVSPESYPASAAQYVGIEGSVGATVGDIVDFVKNSADGLYSNLKSLISNNTTITYEVPITGEIVPTPFGLAKITGTSWARWSDSPGPSTAQGYYPISDFKDSSGRQYYTNSSRDKIYRWPGAYAFTYGVDYYVLEYIAAIPVTMGDPVTPDESVNYPELKPQLNPASSPEISNEIKDVIQNLPKDRVITSTDPAPSTVPATSPSPITNNQIQNFFAENTTNVYNKYLDTVTNNVTNQGDVTNEIAQAAAEAAKAQEEEASKDSEDTYAPISSNPFQNEYNPGEFDIPARFTTFLENVKSSGLFSFSSAFFNSLPGGGSSAYTINGGATFGTHTIDLSDTLSGGLAVLKTILLACFGFLSIRAVIMKR